MPEGNRPEDQWLTACSGGDSAWTTVVGQSRVVAAKAVMAVGAIAPLSHVSVIRRLQEKDKVFTCRSNGLKAMSTQLSADSMKLKLRDVGNMQRS